MQRSRQSATQLIKKLITFVNIKTIITTLVSSLVIWVGVSLLTSFREVKQNYSSDREKMKIAIPAIKNLQINDSIKTYQINKLSVALEVVNSKLDDVKSNTSDIKDMVFQVITGNRQIIQQTNN